MKNEIEPVEYVEKIRILSLLDIGLFKLKSAYYRKANKDFYDLDFLTDCQPFSQLVEKLKEKESIYSGEQYKCIFDLDETDSVLNNIKMLIDFDEINYESQSDKPSHSNDLINIIQGQKKLPAAKRSFKRKVAQFIKETKIL